jgi:hypothetical protein
MLSVVLPAQAVLLRYTPKVGTITKHSISMSGRMEMTSEMLPQAMRMQLTATIGEREKVLGQTEGGYKVQTSTSGGTVKMTGDGLEGAQSQKAPASSIVAIYDDRSRVMRVVSMKGAKDPSMGMGGDSDFSALGGIPLPEEDVKPGDTWADEIKMPMGEGMPEATINTTSRLLELATYKGRKCAKIRTTMNGPFSLDMSQIPQAQGAQGSADGTLEGTMTAYYDYEKCTWVDASGKVTMNMNMNVNASPPGSEGGGMSMTMGMKMAMNIKMTLAK